MNHTIQYTLERWPLGWTLSTTPGAAGVPALALKECAPLFPRHILDGGIAHHLRQTRHPQVMGCIALPHHARTWREQIALTLQPLPPPARWWLGTDVGRSSAALFTVLCREDQAAAAVAREFSLGLDNTPQDADDFGRCRRLLDAFPAWRERLPEVAAAYPDGAWPDIIRRFQELESADDATPLLRSIHESTYDTPPSAPRGR